MLFPSVCFMSKRSLLMVCVYRRMAVLCNSVTMRRHTYYTVANEAVLQYSATWLARLSNSTSLHPQQTQHWSSAQTTHMLCFSSKRQTGQVQHRCCSVTGRSMKFNLR